MKLAIHLFAIARERAGTPVVQLEMPIGSTVGDARKSLVAAHPDLASLLACVRIAVDSEYVDDTHVIEGSSELAVIPPVSGGGAPGTGWDAPDQSNRRGCSTQPGDSSGSGSGSGRSRWE